MNTEKSFAEVRKVSVYRVFCEICNWLDMRSYAYSYLAEEAAESHNLGCAEIHELIMAKEVAKLSRSAKVSA